MMPDQPEFTKCHACACFCWVKDMTRLGDQQPWEDNACRDPLSYDVIITEIWDDLEPVVERLARHFEQNQPALLKQLAALKQRLARQTWQQIVVEVYANYPQYTVESELLPKIRKTQTEQQPE